MTSEERFKPHFGMPQNQATPLEHFRGVLKDYVAEDRQPEGGNPYKVITFNFIELEVLRSSEPFPFPAAPIPISWSTSSNTKWAALAASARKVLPAEDIELLVGTKQEWELRPCKLRAKSSETGKWEIVDGVAWQINSVEGYGSAENAGVDLTERLCDLADGKTEVEFNTAVFADSDLRAMPGFTKAVESITSRQFFPMMQTAGKLRMDSEEKWHKVS